MSITIDPCAPVWCGGEPIWPQPGVADPVVPDIDSLYELVARRIRWANTIFRQNVKLILRQMDNEQWSLLKPPYLLVVPTVTRPVVRPIDQEAEIIVNPRSVTLIAQLDARGSEAEWMAARDIEIAEKQLIGALVNWRPQRNYAPSLYAGMRLQSSRAPEVKVSFVFTFYEQLVVLDTSEIDPEDLLEVERITVRVSLCPPVCPQPEALPVPPVCVITATCTPVAEPVQLDCQECP